MSSQKIKKRKSDQAKLQNGFGASSFQSPEANSPGMTIIKNIKSSRFLKAELQQNDLISDLPRQLKMRKPKPNLDIISNCPQEYDEIDDIATIMAASSVKDGGTSLSSRPPLQRSRTLPAIILPGINASCLGDPNKKDGIGSPHRVAPAASSIRPRVTVTTHEDDNTTTETCLLEGSYAGPTPGGLKVPGGSSGLGRISRLLTKEPKGESDSFRRRTHSLESKFSNTTLRRAASIDSLVDATNNNISNSKSSTKNGGFKISAPMSPYLSKRGSASSASGKSSEKQSPQSPAWSTMDVLVDGLNLTKADRKKLEKINKINIHLHALFAAVEHGQLEKARNILKNNTFDINSVNSDSVNVLEVAVMNNHVPMAKMLQQAGATECATSSIEKRLRHMEDLVSRAERRREELSCLVAGGAHLKETERQRALWDRRCKILRRMKMGLEKLQVPGSPSSAAVEVVDGTRVKVSFHESATQHMAVTTKFRVEWSVDEWQSVAGSREIHDLRRLYAIIDNLPQGRRHHFRVAAGNMRGFGQPISTSPASAVPSSWRDVDPSKPPRLEGLLRDLNDLFRQVRNSRPECAAEIRNIEPGIETPLPHRRAQKKKSIKNLFTLAPKFSKSLKRGSYLACIMYCEDKVLVTNEDFPPVVEVDENYLTQPRAHFHWLMKIATTWEDVKSLRQDMEQAGSASHLPYRIKLLQAAAAMQTSLGIQDLGQFYYKPIKDTSGTVVFCCVKQLRSTKAISSMNARWVPMAKFKEKKALGLSPTVEIPGGQTSNLLLNSLEDQVTYNTLSQVPLKRGLYLCYLKLQSSVDQLQVIVNKKAPNMFPYVKIRENPHVSREEWEWVKSLYGSTNDCWSTRDDQENHGFDATSEPLQPTPAQLVWHKELTQSTEHLLEQLSVEPETRGQHRLYTKEVLELGSEVSLLLLLPAQESVCCLPGQEDALLSQPGLMALPLHTFEMIHMGAYQSDLLSRYARLSYILEMDKLMAQHASREAFSQDEISASRDRLWQLEQFQSILDLIWRRLRWVMDAITFARDKAMSGVPLASLAACMDLHPPQTPNATSSLFQDAQNSSSESLHVGTENKKFRKDDAPSFRSSKSVGPRMLKSITTDNIRTLDKVEVKFAKSKTSDCVFRSTSCSRCTSLKMCGECLLAQEEYKRESLPLLQWNQERYDFSNERKMYNKDNITCRSENTLQVNPEPVYFPRKASAPSYLISVGSSSESCCDKKESDREDCISVKSSDSYRQKGSNNSETDVEIPAENIRALSNVYGINEQSPRMVPSTNQEPQRASSSMSHDSETSFLSVTPSLRSLSSNETEVDTVSLTSKESGRSEASENRSMEGEDSEGVRKSEEPAVIQVYAAYETGLAPGTSVKLHVMPRTTAREVIDLVVKQLNMAVVLKGKEGPVYGSEKLKNFCLVAVIGARERCLRDDFRPLQLQNPWKKGKLYVRLKHDVLAAIDQSNSRHSSYL